MKVMHLLSSSVYAGAENVAITIIKSMSDEYQFCYVSPDGSIRSILDNASVPNNLTKAMTISHIRHVVNEFRPDIIHAHDYKASALSVLSGIQQPILSHIHQNAPWMKRTSFYSLFYLLVSCRIKHILAVSNSIIEQYRFRWLIENKSTVLTNPIDAKSIREKALMANLDISYDFVYMGRLSGEKDPLRFIYLLEKAAKIRPGFSAALIGSGELEVRCREAIREGKLSDSVTLLGFLDNPFPILAKANALCVTSRWEGFGLAAVEALSLGVPVIAFSVGGLTEILSDDCGKLCNCDEEYIAEMLRLLDDAVYRTEKSHQAKRRADQLDNIDQYTKELSCIYQSLIVEN